MTNAEARIVHLEQELRRDELAIAALQTAVAALQQAVRTAQTSPYGGGSGGGGIYSIPAVIIAAQTGSTPGSVTGQTVSALVGGSLVTVNASGTVYNQMAAATVATSGKTIIVGANSDGTYMVITQSC
jgi:hypothetical protein